jgi:hypothetical protein
MYNRQDAEDICWELIVSCGRILDVLRINLIQVMPLISILRNLELVDAIVTQHEGYFY